MPRLPMSVLALATAAVLGAVPAAAAPAVGPDAPPIVSIEFDHLPANHGMAARLDTFKGDATLEIERKSQEVSYQVPAEISPTGLKAQFGELGLIDVAFRPTETVRVERPPDGCDGRPSTYRRGLFVGTIQFAGERDYVRIEASQLKGEMSVNRSSGWRCSRRRSLRRADDEPATLSAYDRRCRCFFLALAERDSRHDLTAFIGAVAEHRERMEIFRATSVDAGASAFVFDHRAGTARLSPPRPFIGHATFKRRPRGRDRWSSTIRVPLLGADPLRVRGRGFRVRLVRDLPGD